MALLSRLSSAGSSLLSSPRCSPKWLSRNREGDSASPSQRLSQFLSPKQARPELETQDLLGQSTMAVAPKARASPRAVASPAAADASGAADAPTKPSSSAADVRRSALTWLEIKTRQCREDASLDMLRR